MIHARSARPRRPPRDPSSIGARPGRSELQPAVGDVGGDAINEQADVRGDARPDGRRRTGACRHARDACSRVDGRLCAQSAGVSVDECVRRECEEEASLPPQAIDGLKPAGLVSYRYATPKGLSTKARPHRPFSLCISRPRDEMATWQVLATYDLEMPGGLLPLCADGEVRAHPPLSHSALRGRALVLIHNCCVSARAGGGVRAAAHGRRACVTSR